MWQKLQTEMKDKGFTVVAVAMDSNVEAARPWIEAAKPEYPALIDRDHHVSELYNMVNVPQCVWIDEDGRIVRPPEVAGTYEGFRKMDRSTFTIPAEAAAVNARARETYYAALRDWIEKGAQSRFAYDPTAAREKIARPSQEVAQAHAWFRLGRALAQRGDKAGADAAFAKAKELHPDSWNMWRETLPKDARGLATGPAFWARLDALGDKRYYAKVDIEGMP